ncbi:MAG TPA: carbohydrate kinase family protein [Candidatus Aenigmarchaeota archaeon]|nr:carbohydrate kinase family protein [Candidatus Aenigmarchaeota archaeon]
MNKALDVIGVGSLVVDIFTDSPYMIIELRQRRKESLIALPTEKILSKVTIRGGGSSGNTVAYLSRLGLRCGYFTKLGYDIFSEFLINDLKRFKVDVSHILRETNVEAGKSVIVSSLGLKDHALIVDHGAADMLTVSDFKKNLNYLLSTKWLDITSFTNRKAIEGIKFLVREAKKNGINVFFAPSKTMIINFQTLCKEILKNVDVISLNEEELLLLFKKKSLEKGLKALKKSKLKYAFVTRGKNGIISMFEKKFYKIGAYKVKDVKNTTGAGDIAASWFLYGIIKKYSIKRILNYAAVAAAFHVKKNVVGAREALPSKREIEKYLEKVRNLPVKEIKVG